jgi:hypothetical protein
MAQSFEDRVEQEVRKRLTLAASAAGVDRGRIELEILFLLPPQFVRNYRELFDRALADPIKPSTDGGKDEGRVKAPGKPGDAMKARSMGGAAPGKKFIHGAWPIRDEVAVEAKRRLDKKILAAVKEALELVRPTSIGAARMQNESIQLRCTTCGFFQKVDWIRCPYHL